MDDMKPKHMRFGWKLIIAGVVITAIGIAWWIISGFSLSADTQSVDKAFDGSSITSIDLSIDTADVKIVSGAGDEIKITGNNIPVGRYSYNADNGSLVIKTSEYKWYEWYKKIALKNTSGEFTVELPDKLYKSLKLEMGVGNLSITDINCEKAELNSGVGDVKLGGFECSERLDADIGVGDLSFEDCTVNKSTLDCGTGDISFSGVINGRLDADLGVGDITLNIDGSYEDYEISTDGIGETTVDKGSAESTGKSITLDIDAGVGDININFK